jgi:TolA-binding protein
MLSLFVKWLGRQISLVKEVDQLRGQVERLRSDLCELREDLIHAQTETEIRFTRESAEREKFMLQVQNLLLQWERRLPSARPKPTRKPRRRKSA